MQILLKMYMIKYLNNIKIIDIDFFIQMHNCFNFSFCWPQLFCFIYTLNFLIL